MAFKINFKNKALKGKKITVVSPVDAVPLSQLA